MSLSHIQSLRLAAVLEDSSDQLNILGHIMSVKIESVRGIAPGAEQERARLNKLIKNCQDIIQQVSKLHLELEEEQSFRSVLQLVEEEAEKRREENKRREAMKEVMQRQQRLDQRQDELQQKTKELKDLDEVFQNLNHEKGEQSSKIDKKKEFLEKNIALQLLLNQSETEEAEKLLEGKQELLRIQMVEEVKVHERTKEILHNQHKELQEQQQQWRQRTQQMLQETEQKVNDVCCKRTVNMDKLTEMRRKFREMEKVVMEDRKEQEKLRQQQAEIKAAIKLQAWWRGCMVRKGLGSFKKADDNKKGKKKKEGKKKKK